MQSVRAYTRRAAIGIAVVAVLAGLTAVGIRLAMRPFTYTSVADIPPSQVALVLGASVVRGAPSPVLKARADGAVTLYKSDKVEKILVTGDNSALSYDEVTPVRKYLLDAGVASGDIFLDHAGFDTYSSMYRAREVFLARSLTIVTQDFHLPRALWIARHLGLDAYGVVAEGGEHSPYDYVREIPASIKAFLDVFIDRQPKYLGPTIPLSGDGEETWY